LQNCFVFAIFLRGLKSFKAAASLVAEHFRAIVHPVWLFSMVYPFFESRARLRADHSVHFALRGWAG
jgi:hypothetical protein